MGAGIWELQSGEISLPPKKAIMFLPQNVYIPDIPLESNTLRGQILFPQTLSAVSDSEIENVLNKVNLGHLMSDLGAHTKGDWRAQLSGGEKQRIAMARLLITKPTVAFLDEATSALDEANERNLYEALQLRGATYISVGHKAGLRKYHSHILELKAGGEWGFSESPE